MLRVVWIATIASSTGILCTRRRWRRRLSGAKTLRKVARRSAILTTTRAHRPRPWTAAHERSFVRAASSYTWPPGRRQPRPRYIIATGELDTRHRVVTAFRDENNIIGKAPVGRLRHGGHRTQTLSARRPRGKGVHREARHASKRTDDNNLLW